MVRQAELLQTAKLRLPLPGELAAIRCLTNSASRAD